MPRRIIEVPGLGHGTMPIPLAAVVGGLLATGGVSGTDPATGQRPDALDAEVAQVFANLRAILAAAGMGPESVLKITFSVLDRSVRDLINTEWVAMFPDEHDRPARHTVVNQLPASMRVQAEMLAIATDVEDK